MVAHYKGRSGTNQHPTETTRSRLGWYVGKFDERQSELEENSENSAHAISNFVIEFL